MPGKALWKGVIVFGGVSVPVKLYTTFRDIRVHFTLLHDQDGVRLQQEMWDPFENVPVHREHQVKGYEISGGEYVLVNENELEELQPEGGRYIEVMGFIQKEDIDLRYYDHAYFLGPDDGGEKMYANLRNALGKTIHIGICRWVMRKKQFMGVLTLTGEVLALIVIHFADEIEPLKSLEIPAGTKVSKQERDSGLYLIHSLTVPFKPEKYKNEFDHRLRQLIKKKAKGIIVSPAIRKKKEPEVSDNLLETLKASIEQMKAKK